MANRGGACACLYANGEPYVIVRAPTQQVYAMREDGTFWTVQLDDVGLIAIDAPPLQLGSRSSPDRTIRARKDTSMTAVETATKTLNDLLDKRDQLVARSAKLTSDRQKISLPPTPATRARRNVCARSTTRPSSTTPSLSRSTPRSPRPTPALPPPTAEAIAADRANAEQLRVKLAASPNWA